MPQGWLSSPSGPERPTGGVRQEEGVWGQAGVWGLGVGGRPEAYGVSLEPGQVDVA